MDVAAFYYLEGGLLFSFLVAAGLTVVSLNRPNYRVARRCAWASAILFGSIAVVWGLTTMESTWIRIPAVGIAGLVAAICLTEALRFIKERELPPAKAAETDSPASRGPTLEADSSGAINAPDAVIPGDLPYQFGKASTGGFINMPRIRVTRKDENTVEVTPGHAELNFPPPPEELVWLANEELRSRIHIAANDIRLLQREYSAQFDEDKKFLPDREPLKKTIEKYIGIYKTKYADEAFALAAAALNRIGTIQQPDISRAASSGGSLVYAKQFAGPSPGNDIAEFLDLLAKKLGG
jgi:hypothetical protein